MPSMLSPWLHSTLSHMLTNLIFTTNPWDMFYDLHFTDVKTKVCGSYLAQGQNASKRQNQDFNPSLLILSPVSFLGFYATVSMISIGVILSLALCQYTATFTPTPPNLSRIFLKFASSRALCYVPSRLCI